MPTRGETGRRAALALAAIGGACGPASDNPLSRASGSIVARSTVRESDLGPTK